MSRSSVAPLQGAVAGRRVRSQRELDILALQRRLQAVKDARDCRPEILFKITPEHGDDWDGGLVGDLARAARAVVGRGLMLDRFDRERLARRPWFGVGLDDPQAGWDGLSPPTRELYNLMSTGRLGDPQLGRVTARIDLLVGAAERLLDAVAPIEAPKRRARKGSRRGGVA